MIPDISDRVLERAWQPHPQAVRAVRRSCNGDLRGYSLMAPSAEAADLDRSVCERSQCERCGAEGLAYVPFTAWEDFTDDHGWTSYRAFAVCLNCGFMAEF